jgi:hypothetical protein
MQYTSRSLMMVLKELCSDDRHGQDFGIWHLRKHMAAML